MNTKSEQFDNFLDNFDKQVNNLIDDFHNMRK